MSEYAKQYVMGGSGSKWEVAPLRPGSFTLVLFRPGRTGCATLRLEHGVWVVVVFADRTHLDVVRMLDDGDSYATDYLQVEDHEGFGVSVSEQIVLWQDRLRRQHEQEAEECLESAGRYEGLRHYGPRDAMLSLAVHHEGKAARFRA